MGSPDDAYGIIVAGAGIAGTLAASSAAKAGAKVLIVDRNKPEEPGKKTNWGWVCGDAVAKSHLDFIKERTGISFSKPELNKKVDGVYAISPDMQNRFLFDGEGYVLDRPAFARKLLAAAQSAGAEYRPNVEIEGPIIEDNVVAGIFGRDEKKEQFKLHAKVVIDSLGIASTLRRKLPQNEFIDKEVSIDDIESTGRYIVEFEPNGADEAYYDSRNALIHLNQQMAPGGYGWVFPKEGNIVNIGLGVEKKSLEIRNAKLGKKDTLHSLIDAYIAWNPIVKNTKPFDENGNGKGYWSVAVRRQLDSLAYPGYMGAGDSMAMPNPISAGGIGPAMVAGILSGEVAAEAVSANDASLDMLWKYNSRFVEAYGNKTAGLEVFRIYLQSLNNDLLNYGMGHFLTKEEAEQISYGLMPELTLVSTFQKVLSGIANLNAFKNLVYVVRKMKALNKLYKAYPKTPNDFKPWKMEIEKEMREVKERFKPNPI